METIKKQSFYEFVKEIEQWIEGDTSYIDTWWFREVCDLIDSSNNKKKLASPKYSSYNRNCKIKFKDKGTFIRDDWTLIIDDPNATSDSVPISFKKMI